LYFSIFLTGIAAFLLQIEQGTHFFRENYFLRGFSQKNRFLVPSVFFTGNFEPAFRAK
jgi:hypothetical protein